MAFPPAEADKLLAECKRTCCICHRFCGVKIELDHMVPKAEEGSDEIANAIPVCFECHAEIHSYNDKHGRGRKFHARELRLHKENWLALCRERPEVLLNVARSVDVGPLQALCDELDFNIAVVDKAIRSEEGGDHPVVGCELLDRQFHRAIEAGSVAILREPLKHLLLHAYAAVGRANSHLAATFRHPYRTEPWILGADGALLALSEAKSPLADARAAVARFLVADRE
jgi:hypothetical protein